MPKNESASNAAQKKAIAYCNWRLAAKNSIFEKIEAAKISIFEKIKEFPSEENYFLANFFETFSFE